MTTTNEYSQQVAVELCEYVANSMVNLGVSVLADLESAKAAIEMALQKMQALDISLPTLVEPHRYTMPLKAAISQIEHCVDDIAKWPDSDEVSEMFYNELTMQL